MSGTLSLTSPELAKAIWKLKRWWTVFGEKPLKKTAIYATHKKVKNRETTKDYHHLNGKKTTRTLALITSVATTIDEDHRLSIEALVTALWTPISTIHAMLDEALGLEKSAR